MNIFGVGGPELLIILVLMLIVAGPKRMLRWSYVMGQYIAKFRRMWAETVDVLQHEFDEAGVDIQVPRDLPTRGSLNKQALKMMSPLTDPVKDTLEQVNTEVSEIKRATAATSQAASTAVKDTNGHAAKKRPAVAGKPASTPRKPSTTTNGQAGDGFGAWSSHTDKPGFGSWAAGTQPDDEE